MIITGSPFGARYTRLADSRHYVRDPTGIYRDQALIEGFDANASLQWETLEVFQFSPTSTYTDPCNVTWYGWRHDFRLPSAAGYPYWRVSDDGNGDWQTIKTRVLLLPSGTPLISFDVGDLACLSSTIDRCGGEIVRTCGDADGEITLTCPFNRIGCGS